MENQSRSLFKGILNSTYSFDTFIEVDCNRKARLSAIAVCDLPISKPLVIIGGKGLGKTHLAIAIRFSLIEKYAENNCLYITAQHFIEQYVKAVIKNKISEFKTFFSSIKVLILDDIQHFVNREKSQEILVYLFDLFQLNQNKFIVTSNLSLTEPNGFNEQLVSRLNSGITTILDKPNFESRFKILKSFCEQRNTIVDDDILTFVAKVEDIDIRIMEGFLITIISNSIILNQKLTLEFAISTYNKLKDFNPDQNYQFRYLDFFNKDTGNI